MRLSVGLVLSVLFHAGLVAYALFWSPGPAHTVSFDKPVYTVDLLSLAPPPPPKPAPVIESKPEEAQEPVAPVVEASPEPEPEIEAAPVVEAEQAPEPKVEKISKKKVKKKTVVKKKEEKPKPKLKPKPKPKPKPKKTAAQLRKEALAAAQAEVKRDEAKRARALQAELDALKKKEGKDVYAHGGQEGGTEGGVRGATGSGLSEVYSLIVGLAIKKNWRYPSFAGEANLTASVEITLDAQGKILSSRIVRPSGNAEFDNSTLRAIKETEYVEQPRTERDRVLLINFNSQDLSE